MTKLMRAILGLALCAMVLAGMLTTGGTRHAMNVPPSVPSAPPTTTTTAEPSTTETTPTIETPTQEEETVSPAEARRREERQKAKEDLLVAQLQDVRETVSEALSNAKESEHEAANASSDAENALKSLSDARFTGVSGEPLDKLAQAAFHAAARARDFAQREAKAISALLDAIAKERLLQRQQH